MPKTPASKVSQSSYRHKAAPSQKREKSSSDKEKQSEDYIHGFSSDSDSSDASDDAEAFSDEIDIGKLPTISKDDETVKRKLERAKKQAVTDRGVIYLARIPHGFYEDQMRGYFSQFGNVTRLRLSRNKKTGRSKHYAYIEFDSSSVAQVVAETMDNYLLMGHILVCKVIPKDKVHPELWVGANRKWRKVPHDRIVRVKHNRERTEEEQKRVRARLLQRQHQKQQRLKAAGIDYDISDVGYSAHSNS